MRRPSRHGKTSACSKSPRTCRNAEACPAAAKRVYIRHAAIPMTIEAVISVSIERSQWQDSCGVFCNRSNLERTFQLHSPPHPFMDVFTRPLLWLGIVPMVVLVILVCMNAASAAEDAAVSDGTSLGSPSINRTMTDADTRKGKLLYENSLASEADLAHWKIEGPATMKFEDGWMRLASERPEGPNGHLVIWCEQEFPTSFIAEWEIQAVSEQGLCIVFFAAKGSQGQDLFAPDLPVRTGEFAQYIKGAIDCYHISYYANTPNAPDRGTSNLRKNPGFNLVAAGPEGIPLGSKDVHRIQLRKAAGKIELFVDDKRIIAFEDDGSKHGPALQGGKIGLRQMQWMIARYRNFRVYELL